MADGLLKYLKDIKGDLHVHSSHFGCSHHKKGSIVYWEEECGHRTIEELGLLANKRGMKYIAICNHATDPDHPTPPANDVDQRLLKQQDYISQLNPEGKLGKIYVLSGVESSILPDGNLDVSDEVLEQMDIVIASLHGQVKEADYQRIKAGFLSAIINPFTDIIGHVTRYVSFLSVADWHELFHKAQEMDTALELNTNTPPRPKIMGLMVEHDVKITLGSDTHQEESGEVETEKLIGPGRFIQAQLLANLYQQGVKKENIINTYSLSRLLQWLTRKGV